MLTVFLILLAFIVASLLVYFQYFFKEKNYTLRWLLVFLRFVSIFSILVLLINPKFEKKNYDIIKPKLLIAVDNSSSIVFSKQDTLVKKLIKQIETNVQLNKKFDLEYFSFGNSLNNNSFFDFQESQTNIYQALKGLNTIAEKQIAPIILISDGNQTYGNNYKYYNSIQSIYPIVIGDTTQFSDLSIAQINVNKYVRLDNNFEVELFVNYLGSRKINTNLIVEKNNQIVYSKKIIFSKDKKSNQIRFKLPANNIGRYLYKVKIEPFKNEKHTINNYKNFTIEVIDEQTKVAIVYDVLHPDIGMIKRVIETNKQRKVSLINLNDINLYLSDNDIFILHQPNSKFNKIFDLITSKNKNYFIITGKSTDWNFLNQAQSDFYKKNILSTESYYANYNKGFDLFYTENIGFLDFSPLEDIFGEIKFSVAYQSLLTQNINGLETNNPLLVAISNKDKRRVILFGENSWKWRVLSYKHEQSFEKFDQFFNSLIQFLTIAKTTTPIELTYNSFYYANDPIKISAKIYDDNLNFDIDANLEIFINGDKKGIPFQLKNNYYEVQVADLKSGDYNFIVKNILNSNQVSGVFTIAKYVVEHEVKISNAVSLNTLAKNSVGKSYYPNQINTLFNYLIENQNYVSVQKENKKMISFIDWKWILSLIILSLSLEWFIRKYRGLI
ncbi:MAG: VWA domain-containing protein [Flavobacteriaceae bacterium]|nr:VWA domain-containing protein [Flavobacteriaceae bacterium]